MNSITISAEVLNVEKIHYLLNKLYTGGISDKFAEQVEIYKVEDLTNDEGENA